MEEQPNPRSIPVPPARRPELVLHAIDDEALIYDPRTADTHRLNATALFIWRCCDGRSMPHEIALRITDTYDINLDEAIEHVRRTIGEFAEKSLLLESESTDPDQQHAMAFAS